MKYVRTRNIVLVLLLAALLGLGIPLWLYFPGYNLRVVEPGVFYGARQMSQSAMEHYIDTLQIKTVLNMRGKNPGSDWYDGEVAACANKGVVHLDFGWSRNSIPEPDSLKQFLDALDTAQPPFLAHCQGGTHRTGFAAAAYLLHKGHSIQVARKQFGPMFRDAPIGEVVSMYEGSSMTFRQWVETEYPRLYGEWRARHETQKASEPAGADPAPAAP